MARILLIDDDEQVRLMIRTMLERIGHDVVEAQDGVAGVEKFREAPADLVITDIVMPQKGGIATIVELLRDYPGLRIIALSGGGASRGTDYLEVARQIGASRTISMPVDMEELTETVGELLSQPN
ncbi:MAG: response regulator [bacterium]